MATSRRDILRLLAATGLAPALQPFGLRLAAMGAAAPASGALTAELGAGA